MSGEIPSEDKAKYSFAPTDTEKTPEILEKGERRSFDIKNVKGEIVCRVEGTFFLTQDDGSLVSEKLKAYANRYGDPSTKFFSVRDILFASPTGNDEPVPFSVICPTSNISIFVPDKRLENYCHGSNEEIWGKMVIVPPPETANDLGVWFHEFGHEDQAQEETYRELNKHDYLEEGALSELFPPYFRHNLSKIYKTLQEIPGAFTNGQLSLADRDLMEKFIERQNTLEEQAKNLREEFSSLRERAQKEMWSFFLGHTGDIASLEFAAETIHISEAQMDDSGQVAWEPEEEESFDDVREEIADYLRERLMGAQKTISSGGVISVDAIKIGVGWNQEKARAEADLLFTDESKQMGVTVFLPSNVTRENVQGFHNTLNKLHGEWEQLEQTKGKKLQEDDGVLREELHMFLDDRKNTIQNEILRPRRLLEQDATRRALAWVMKLYREHGINLLQEFSTEDVKGGYSAGVPFRVNRDEKEVATIRDGLRAALRSYGADYPQMKPERPTKISPE